jgi:hypothetical protein
VERDDETCGVVRSVRLTVYVPATDSRKHARIMIVSANEQSSAQDMRCRTIVYVFHCEGWANPSELYPHVNGTALVLRIVSTMLSFRIQCPPFVMLLNLHDFRPPMLRLLHEYSDRSAEWLETHPRSRAMVATRSPPAADHQ